MANRQNVFDSYDLLTPLGSGGMGHVYRARDRRIGRDVAIKVLPHKYDAGARLRFLREARMAAMINHPRLATVYEAGADDENAYIVTEYVEGSSLEQIISRGPLPLDLVIRIAQQVAEGLAAIHSVGVVHRDLKPSNILVGSNTSVKIIDFGLAWPSRRRPDDSVTHTGLLIGTPSYMAPEVIGELYVNESADLFALGVTLYEALTGRLPFGGKGPVDVLLAIVNAEPEPVSSIRPDVPATLAELVHRLLSKSPQERPSADVAARLLRDYLIDLGSSDDPPEEKFAAALDDLARNLTEAIEDARAYRNRLRSYGEWASTVQSRSNQENA